MDQTKIGSFLKELRKEKDLSQEQLADRFNVSSRSVSRWENGYTMPDISLLIELADFYNVDIRELLDGERKSEQMNKDLKETLVMVADYTKEEKEKIMKDVCTMAGASLFIFVMLAVINVLHLDRVNENFYGASVFLLSLGIAYSFMSLIKLRVLNGKMNKSGFKKFAIGLVIAGVLILMAAMALIIFVITV